MTLVVTSVRFVAACRRDLHQGLLGWAGANLGDFLRVDGFVVRRTRQGELRVFPPERIDRGGRRHRVVDVIDAELEREIEVQVLVALKAQGVLP